MGAPETIDKKKTTDDTRLVRVTGETHRALRLLAARLDLTLGEAVAQAVAHMSSATPG